MYALGFECLERLLQSELDVVYLLGGATRSFQRNCIIKEPRDLDEEWTILNKRFE